MVHTDIIILPQLNILENCNSLLIFLKKLAITQFHHCSGQFSTLLRLIEEAGLTDTLTRHQLQFSLLLKEQPHEIFSASVFSIKLFL